MKQKCELFNDNFQNFKRYGIDLDELPWELEIEK